MRFAVVDLSSALEETALAAYAAAQQRQLREHYASCYDGDGVGDVVRVFVRGGALADGEVAILLHAAVPPEAGEGALGVHDRDARGVPIIHVYLDLAAKFGDAWQSIASHEVLETRADPRLHACIELDNGEIWDREICDRVEADAYDIDGVPMSNFNTPECFEPAGVEGEKYDWMKLSTRPNEVRPGGYAQLFDPEHGWSQVGAMRGYRGELAAAKLSRGTRRKVRHA